MRGILAGLGVGVVVSGLGLAGWSYLGAPVVMAPGANAIPDAVPEKVADPVPETEPESAPDMAATPDSGASDAEADAPAMPGEAPGGDVAEPEADPVDPAPEAPAPEETAATDSPPADPVPEETLPEDTAPEDTAPGETRPEGTSPEDTPPAQAPEVASDGPAMPDGGNGAAEPGMSGAPSAPEEAAPPVDETPPDVAEAAPDTVPAPETAPAGAPVAGIGAGAALDAPDTDAAAPGVPGAEESVQAVPDAALPPEPVGEALPAVPAQEELARPAPPDPAPTEPAEAEAEPVTPEETVGLGIPVPELGAFAPDIPTDNLPRIGAADTGATDETGQPEAGPAPAPAIERFGTPFEPPQDTPILAILLLDPGAGRPDPSALAGFPVPLTIGIDPTLPGAADAMAAYRAAGHEVAVLTPLPEGAAPADVEVLFQGYLDAVPEAAAVLDVPAARLQENRPRAAQIAAILAETGHGMITYERGLNPGLQVAGTAGVPAAAVFRDFDDGTRQISAMKRLLDVGAFRAGQQGAALMVGTLRKDAVAALAEWVLGNRAASVTLAPVSALLKAGR